MLVVAGVVATAPGAWWVGHALNNSEGAVPADQADYLWRPLSLSTATSAAVGLGALVLVGGALAVLVRQVRSGRWRTGWLQVAAASAMLCSYAGLLVAVATAPVIGANIGAGMMLLGAAPVGLGAVIWIVIALVHLRSAVRVLQAVPPSA